MNFWHASGGIMTRRQNSICAISGPPFRLEYCQPRMTHEQLGTRCTTSSSLSAPGFGEAPTYSTRAAVYARQVSTSCRISMRCPSTASPSHPYRLRSRSEPSTTVVSVRAFVYGFVISITCPFPTTSWTPPSFSKARVTRTTKQRCFGRYVGY